MSWERISWKRIVIKLLVGVLFSPLATLGFLFYKYGEYCFKIAYLYPEKLTSKLILFFLIGYFIIGNSFAPENKNTWK